MQDSMFISISQNEKECINWLNDTIAQAVNERVADVHFQHTDQRSRVRFRLPGGALVDYSDIKKEWVSIIDDKIRARARLSTVDRLTTQDGRISLRLNGMSVDIRVAITPGVNGGQLTVCRLLNQSNSNKQLADIRMTPATREAFERIINEPNGLFLVTGPTGSGKTTTLYALLNELNSESRNIITIENPVEYRIPAFHQMNVDGESMTFGGALRSALRQDPDIIMIGEIRDQETAHIAVQAAITGHLVLSTLHANNAAMAITRLIELGIDPHTLSAALRGVSAQRLIRTLSHPESCIKSPPNEMEKTWLSANNVLRPQVEYLRATDPKKDYKGFLPVMEVILADSRVKKALTGGVEEIYAAASRQPQFETLAQAAESFAYAGLTTLDEACHVSSVQEAPSIKNRRLGQVLVDQGIVRSDVMDEILSHQAESRRSGSQHRLGKMLIEHGHCTFEQFVNAVGHTAEAYDIVMKVCVTEERRHALVNVVRQWTPGIDSLFNLALEANLITHEELINATTV